MSVATSTGGRWAAVLRQAVGSAGPHTPTAAVSLRSALPQHRELQKLARVMWVLDPVGVSPQSMERIRALKM